MRFCNIITTHNQDYINKIIKNLSETELDNIISLYKKISMVEYTDELKNECMYAILDDYLLSKLDQIYKKYNIKYTTIDITNVIIFDDPIKTKYKNYNNLSVQKDILNLIEEFKMNWISKDDILDKIIERGIDSLTKIDLKILKS